MSHHGNEEEHESEPVSFRDNRKIDPETGEVRGQQEDAGNPAPEDTGAGGQDAPAETDPEQDVLAQAEAILNEAGAEGEENAPADPAGELRNDLLRLQAEYVNYRRRVERDRDVAREQAVIGVLNSLMPVLDDIDAGRQHGDLREGPFAAIIGKLENVLATYGLARIDEVGVEFDPNIHEALIQQPSAEVARDSVSQILRVGYRKDERVLRAAQVIVAVPE
ncbi:nucleotide exchange factor GrpE [Arthrobacter echini]|uniref:Protein GrpE n=1 Tax=Arthrobacter echini TaxID=1529066 RepID=A0A4S5EA35_9MICC|nr:nucleotide exchange factor GrpE [Arthrobacter echini]THJ68472.1 nucleotide exchange factor GrpE [Arthrobacter echini]